MTDEISRSERARQERMAEKPKETERPKDKPSQFDRVLEESRSVQRSLPLTQTNQRLATEQAVKEAQKRDDRSHDDEKQGGKEKDRGKDEGKGEKRQGLKEGGERITAKGHIKDGGGGQGGHGKGGGGLGHQRRQISTIQLKTAAKLTEQGLHGKFAEKLQAGMTKIVENPRLSQAILNQLVQYVRMGINRKGDDEIQIDLHEKVFRGLKLRLSHRQGRINVHFITHDAKTKSIFEASSDEIKNTLKEKGIMVEDIRIT